MDNQDRPTSDDECSPAPFDPNTWDRDTLLHYCLNSQKLMTRNDAAKLFYRALKDTSVKGEPNAKDESHRGLDHPRLRATQIHDNMYTSTSDSDHGHYPHHDSSPWKKQHRTLSALNVSDPQDRQLQHSREVIQHQEKVLSGESRHLNSQTNKSQVTHISSNPHSSIHGNEGENKKTTTEEQAKNKGLLESLSYELGISSDASSSKEPTVTKAMNPHSQEFHSKLMSSAIFSHKELNSGQSVAREQENEVNTKDTSQHRPHNQSAAQESSERPLKSARIEGHSIHEEDKAGADEDDEEPSESETHTLEQLSRAADEISQIMGDSRRQTDFPDPRLATGFSSEMDSTNLHHALPRLYPPFSLSYRPKFKSDHPFPSDVFPDVELDQRFAGKPYGYVRGIHSGLRENHHAYDDGIFEGHSDDLQQDPKSTSSKPKVCSGCGQEKKRVYRYLGAEAPVCNACNQHWRRHAHDCNLCKRLFRLGANIYLRGIDIPAYRTRQQIMYSGANTGADYGTGHAYVPFNPYRPAGPYHGAYSEHPLTEYATGYDEPSSRNLPDRPVPPFGHQMPPSDRDAQ
eukprot:TRINITY_DN13154_c0_g1_i1.p1 TRINITY_DN13154_c0_g1~~TRINITY_DN13154_c0_g1_i1.p1  ORF type:complete len:656 (-),score=92.44 TRINITY_DN13154_c0_g1_i1:254-1969(-)